jgi:hypothetical protein
MKLGSRKVLAALALALVSSVAVAAVTFDPETGTGFVGKGDVQLAFGWNDAALQAKADGVTFSMEATTNYEAVCTFTTGEGTLGQKTHNVPHTSGISIDSSVSSATRRGPVGQVTGFNLLGFGTTSVDSGSIPVVGGPCPGNEGHGGIWTSVTQSGNGEGGLYVNYGDQKVLIWQ